MQESNRGAGSKSEVSSSCRADNVNAEVWLESPVSGSVAMCALAVLGCDCFCLCRDQKR